MADAHQVARPIGRQLVGRSPAAPPVWLRLADAQAADRESRARLPAAAARAACAAQVGKQAALDQREECLVASLHREAAPPPALGPLQRRRSSRTGSRSARDTRRGA